MATFRDVPPRPDYVELEHEVLRLWTETQAFERLREQTRGAPKWSFLDGPITANNPMGVHHAWGRTYKDVFNRYNAMLGRELRWQQGFDCQGLWVEVQVEKDLGFSSKRQIEEYGVAAFVNACKQRVYRFADVISEQSRRLGYWMDWGNSYYTLSDENNYGIWGFLKLCHERGWLYRGHDVLPWCPRCGTALSEHEIATEGYAELTHLALTVALPLHDRPGESLLVWTTTPWTLPANVAAAVHPELTYVRVGEPGAGEGARSFWVVQGALERLQQSVVGRRSSAVVLEERLGAELVGWRYDGPFDSFEAQRGAAHRVVAWQEVGENEGTGVVHVAPGAGREDYALGQVEELPVLAPLDESGVYVAGYGWLSGRAAGAVAEEVAADLQARGLLFDREQYSHRYPVCWRCGTELVFRLVDEWFIRMDELRGPMMDAARQARWLPAFGLDRELDWLRHMDDWMISKKRYWGLALPFYPCDVCGHVTVVGSKEELRQRAAAGWEDFEGHSPHRPWVDDVLVACERCGAATRRVADVGNVWLDAGIVAFSTMGYYQDQAVWQQWYPADLVLESFPGQFRNWFYALLAMSTAIDGRAPFKTLLGYALVKDERGEEMHKSKGNAIWFEDAAAWRGVEPLRWLFAGAPLDRNVNFGRGLVEETARRLQPLWEVYRFFVTYANIEGLGAGDLGLARSSPAPSPQSPLDLWLLARLDQLVMAANASLGSFDARGFTLAVEAFLDDLSNWYVRRSRRRFWGGRGVTDGDRRAAFATLYRALVTLARLLAPVLPFLAEALYQNLVRSVDRHAPPSVHLMGYPTTDDRRPATDDRGEGRPDGRTETAEAPVSLDAPAPSLQPRALSILSDMALARRAVALGRAARKAAGLRVRQPLARVLVAVATPGERSALERLRGELLEELNVKALEVLVGGEGLLRYQLKPNLRLLGPRLGPRLPALRAALAALDEERAAKIAGAVAAGESVTVHLDGHDLPLAPEEVLVETAGLAGYAVAQDGGLQVALDPALTDELRREGLARDLVRAVQEARKSAGLDLADRVELHLDPERELGDLLDGWEDYLREETLATAIARGAPPPGAYVERATLGGMDVTIGLVRA